jgi:hypothetical protein
METNKCKKKELINEKKTTLIRSVFIDLFIRLMMKENHTLGHIWVGIKRPSHLIVSK